MKSLIVFILVAGSLSFCTTPRDYVPTPRPIEHTPETSKWALEQQSLQRSIAAEQHEIRSRLKTVGLKAPYFWRLSKQGKTSWLLGTVHFDVSASDLPRPIKEIFQKSRQVVMETDIGKIHDDWQKVPPERTAEEPLQPEDDPLWKHMDKKAWAKFCLDLPFTPESLARLSPTSAYYFYVRVRSGTLFPFSTLCMDCDLYILARAAGKPILPLETVAGIVESTRQENLDRQHFTGETLTAFLNGDPIPKIKEHILERLQEELVYREGDLDALTKYVGPNHYQEVIAARNKLWAPKLASLLQKDNTFVAVGAGHLTGPDSLLLLLQAHGYSVTRWPF